MSQRQRAAGFCIKQKILTLARCLKVFAMPAKKKVDAGDDWSGGDGALPGREAIGPLFLMAVTPPFSIVYFHVCRYVDGNFLEFSRLCLNEGLFSTIYKIWPDPWDSMTWKMILSFMVFQLILMKTVPGKRFEATLTPKGNLPVYTANGMACFVINLVALLLLDITGIFSPAVVYDKYGNILSSLNVFAWLFCTFLVIKGHYAPSSTDSGSTGNYVNDFYWGMELYPRVFDWDLKMFTNCRCGMMFWAVSVLCFCYKNAQIHENLQLGIAVSAILQLVYIFKFFHWEMGYMCSMDIQHDRAGYYICWGCLVWVPSVYNSQAFYLTSNGPDINLMTAVAILIAGYLCIFINYESDHQRYVFRQTKGNCLIWGKKPEKIVAEYQSAGKTKESLLLLDGWWKVSRHFHYVPEIMASFFWSVSALDTGIVGPYFYTTFLIILLTDRAFRDDDRCRKKYGKFWDEYCEQVPYKILPGVV